MIGVARSSATSGQAAKQPAKTAPAASPPLDASVFSIVAGLGGHDLNGLRRQWRAHLCGEPPAHLQRWLLMRVLAYRLQADAFGGLDKSTQRILLSNKDEDAAVPFDRRAPQTRDGVGLKAGAMLARAWKGKLERVMILEDGFAWNGRTFGSLSQIAKAMTGTNWNGHRFCFRPSERRIGRFFPLFRFLPFSPALNGRNLAGTDFVNALGSMADITHEAAASSETQKNILS
jgi:hypothetical protein